MSFLLAEVLIIPGTTVYNICDSDKIISLNLVDQLKDPGILIDHLHKINKRTIT